MQKCKYRLVSVSKNVISPAYKFGSTHFNSDTCAWVHLSHTVKDKHSCRCSSLNWWVCKCFQRVSCSETAVSIHSVNLKLSISLSTPFVLSPFILLLLAFLSFFLFPLRLRHDGVNLSSQGMRCQLSRYSNKNKTPNDLKNLTLLHCLL